MLRYELTKENAGVALWGSPWILRAHQENIHDIAERSPIIENKNPKVMGLAYGLRNAYKGVHLKDMRDDGDERLPVFGVEILWPVLIAKVGLLRSSEDHVPTSQMAQGLLFELEETVHAAAEAALPGKGHEVMEHMARIGANTGQIIEPLLYSRACYFISLPPSDRLAALIPVLASLDSGYSAWAEIAHKEGRPGVIPLKAFEAFPDNREGFPDFAW